MVLIKPREANDPQLATSNSRKSIMAATFGQVTPQTGAALKGYPILSDVESRKEAIQVAYEAYVEQIYRFIFFKVGNREDAEDITSQVFIKAANSLDVTQDERTQLAWLYQVARTTITDYWRQYYKGHTSSLNQLEEASPLHLAAEPILLTGSQEEEPDEAAAKVLSILELLPDNYRRVLEFRFLHGYSLKETAQAMNITEANAKVLQHRALQKAVKVGAPVMDMIQ
jgi:RNA polymerase sigma-70 factor (ECF subfamily)